jgi:hypothetical protein
LSQETGNKRRLHSPPPKPEWTCLAQSPATGLWKEIHRINEQNKIHLVFLTQGWSEALICKGYNTCQVLTKPCDLRLYIPLHLTEQIHIRSLTQSSKISLEVCTDAPQLALRWYLNKPIVSWKYRKLKIHVIQYKQETQIGIL